MAMKLTQDENQKYLQLAAKDVPLMGQLVDVKEIANTMLFLASEDSSFTNGEILTIDGG
jgi:NAD(P)-dependent dehydrogenase (short-subunit alcohol dehydrogenase family)